MRLKPRRLSSSQPLRSSVNPLPKTSYKCLVCGKAVSDDILVRVFIAPGDGSYRPGAGVPFVLDISPCCGDRACVEDAWERAKAGVLGEIEIEEIELERDDEEEAPTEEVAPSAIEQRLLDAKDETVVEEFLGWAGRTNADPHDAWNLLPRFLEDAKGFPKSKTRDLSLYYLGFGRPPAVTEKIKLLRDSIVRAVREQDLVRAEDLVPECLAWARGLGLKTIRQADVEVFLSEKTVRLDGHAERALWSKVSLQLRVSKGSK